MDATTLQSTLLGAVFAGKYAIGELPEGEYSRLYGAGGALGATPIQPHPGLRVIAVEETETKRIVGYWPAFNVVHIDGVYLTPDVRQNAVVARAFLGAFADLLQRESIREVYAHCDTPVSAEMAERLGLVALPGTLFMGKIPQAGG